MQYKTISLELIQEHPELYEQLRSSKRLLPAMDAYAIELKERHEHWKDQLGRTQPTSAPALIAGAAPELAIQDLRDRLSSVSPASGEAREPLSLDAAMAYLHRHTPPA